MTYDGVTGYVEFDLAEESAKKIHALKSTLPEDSVAVLAKEVLTQVARYRSSGADIDSPSPEAIERLSHDLISDDPLAGAKFIDGVRTQGASSEAVLLEYLAVAAQTLGLWWEHDKVSFTDVTIGTSRIFGILRGMRSYFASPTYTPSKTALFASVPGETHTLGVTMAADFFRKDGWDIDLKSGLGHDDLVSDIKQSDCSLIGLSLSGEHSVRALSRLVIASRICKPATPILVAGQSIDELKPMIDLMSVDGIAGSIDDAKSAAEALIPIKR
ncbi:MAG: cobalamin B12-binding domain-containing protein [Paracoccaceae bacterium]